mmetsp:Transcript_48821/g.157601  ORF Transcript_48821/g.157601 Transcript_48821/m.157601 type:complete len:82 (+) Transcript_48821:206-451(+)
MAVSLCGGEVTLRSVWARATVSDEEVLSGAGGARESRAARSDGACASMRHRERGGRIEVRCALHALPERCRRRWLDGTIKP